MYVVIFETLPIIHVYDKMFDTWNKFQEVFKSFELVIQPVPFNDKINIIFPSYTHVCYNANVIFITFF